MGEPRLPAGPPEPPASPEQLGWVRWGVTLAGVGLAVGAWGIAADDRAGLRDRVQMGLVGLGGLGFAAAMWVPPFARAFGSVLRKLQ